MPEVGDPLYLTLRLLHILGVVAFLGGLVLALYWKLSGDRSGDPLFASRVHKRLRRMDAHVIGPGALFTFAAGYIMVRGFGSRIAERPFALWGLILMFTALGFWFFGMRRLGDGLATEAEAAAANREALSVTYAKRSAAWVGSALAAITLVVIVTVMMVFKLPGA